MIGKLLVRTLVAAAVVGTPVLFFSAPKIWANAKKTVNSLWEGDAKAGSDTTAAVDKMPPVILPGVPAKISPLEVEGPKVKDFGEVFRFDISTEWIMNRWQRVSTGLAQLQLQGYRVPLVTGTAKDDIAGSLTYYFNPSQQVQTITFNGTTGDATKLVRFLTKRYGFARRIANDPGLFVYEVPMPDGKTLSVLRVRTNGILKADQPFTRFKLALNLERPPAKE